MSDLEYSHIPPELIVNFDIYDMVETGEDIFEIWHSMSEKYRKEDKPLIYTPLNGGHWLATEGLVLADFYADTENLSNSSNTIPAPPDALAIFPAEADGRYHMFTRRAAIKAFTPSAVKRTQPKIREIVRDLVAGIQPRGECDFMADFAFKLPMSLFMHIMGLPQDDGPILGGYTEMSVRGRSYEERLAGREGLFRYLTDVIDDRMKNPGTDTISEIGKAAYFDGTMPPDQVLGIAVNLLLGGLDTVASVLGFFMLYLSDHPADRAVLAADEDKIDASLNEILRRFPIASLGRVVARDFHYRGVELRKGERVLLPTALHGMDERQYERPLELQLDRHIPQLLTFGHGKHQCLGQFLARYELKEAIAAWLDAIPDYRLTVDRSSLRTHCSQANALATLPLAWK